MTSDIGKAFSLIIPIFTDNVNLIWTKMIPNGCRAYKKAPVSVQVCIGVTTFATMTPGVVAGGIGTYYWAVTNPETIMIITDTVIPVIDNLFLGGTTANNYIELISTILHNYNPWGVKWKPFFNFKISFGEIIFPKKFLKTQKIYLLQSSEKKKFL